jgi:3-methyladenine DNA glycosylase AlkD
MAWFGIKLKNAYGVSIPNLRKIAKRIRKNHHLAQELWSSGVHEAKILASLIDEPKKVTNRQMEHWVVCDQRCSNLLDKTRPILRIKKRLNGVNETRNSSSERDLF